MTGIRSQRSMKRVLYQPPVFSVLPLVSSEAIALKTPVCIPLEQIASSWRSAVVPTPRHGRPPPMRKTINRQLAAVHRLAHEGRRRRVVESRVGGRNQPRQRSLATRIPVGQLVERGAEFGSTQTVLW